MITTFIISATKCIKEWTPPGFNCRTSVHEYGGGAFLPYGGSLYFSNFTDQQLYVQHGPDKPPKQLTNKDKLRYADGHYSQKVRL